MKKDWEDIDDDISNRVDLHGKEKIFVLFYNRNDSQALVEEFKGIGPKLKTKINMLLCDVGDGNAGMRFG